jgi:regulator of replication initiation timing
LTNMKTKARRLFLELFRRTLLPASSDENVDVLKSRYGKYNEIDTMIEADDTARIDELEWQVTHLQLRYDELVAENNRLRSELERLYRSLNQIGEVS